MSNWTGCLGTTIVTPRELLPVSVTFSEIQLARFYDYGTNPPLYPEWQVYFRKHQPPTLITWGKNDPIFPAEGAHPYKRDLNNLEFHLLDTGHFALEEDGAVIAQLMRDFLERNLGTGS